MNSFHLFKDFDDPKGVIEPLYALYDQCSHISHIKEDNDFVAHNKYIRWAIRKLEYQYVISHMPDLEGSPLRILDAGCGLSLLPHYFSKLNYEVYAIDNDYEVIKSLHANHIYDILSTRVTYLCSTCAALPFRDNYFDVVTSISVFEHIFPGHDVLSFQEIFRILKPGGRLIFTCDVSPFSPRETHTQNWSENLRFLDQPHHANSLFNLLNSIRDWFDFEDEKSFLKNLDNLTWPDVDQFWLSTQQHDRRFTPIRNYLAMGGIATKKDAPCALNPYIRIVYNTLTLKEVTRSQKFFQQTSIERMKIIQKLQMTCDERQSLIDSLHKDAQERLVVIESLQQTCNDRQSLLDTLQQTCEERQSVIYSLHKDAQERLSVIETLQKICEERQSIIDTLHHDSQERLAVIDSLQTTCDERQSLLEKMKQTCDDRQSLILSLQHDSEERLSVIETMQTTSEKQQFVIDSLITQINNLQKVDENFNYVLITKENEILRLTCDARLRVIQEQEIALQAFRQRRYVTRIKQWLTPQLGILYQHHPIPLQIPPHYTKKVQLTDWPTISIVTPSYNQGGFIERTIQSIIDQEYCRLEYIVQDGGSSDETIEILEQYSPSLTGWESKKDGGQTNALNHGFRKTTGEIMAWLNSDDMLLPGTLHYVANYFKTHPEVDVVYGHRILIDEYDRMIGKWILPPHDKEVMKWADYIPQETMFWRRSIWDKVGSTLDENFHFALDWDLILRFQEAGAVFKRLPRFMGAFRIHLQQKTSAHIGEIGIREMKEIRKRCHGRIVTDREINQHIKYYLYKNVILTKLYHLGIIRY